MRNDGSVMAEAGARLSLEDDVSGSGSWQGDIVFGDGFAIGAAQATTVSFGGGHVHFDPTALLTLQVRGAHAGAQDRLIDIDTLQLEGRLVLVFSPAFAAPEGAVLDLLDFSHFEGGLDVGRIQVTGLDRARLDFSRLALDGSVHISEVPEPAHWALWTLGLAVLSARRRWQPAWARSSFSLGTSLSRRLKPWR